MSPKQTKYRAPRRVATRVSISGSEPIPTEPPFDLSTALASLRAEHPGYELRLKRFVPGARPSLPRLTTEFFYLTFRQGLPTTDEFARFLADEIVAFVLPRGDRAETDRLIVSSSPEMQRRIHRAEYDRSRRLFVEAARASGHGGECGELILYLLLEAFSGAPQLVSKLYLKTARNMNVHGSDGIHVSLTHDQPAELLLFLGESKGYREISHAIDDALDSVEQVMGADARDRELQIFHDHADLPRDSELYRQVVSYVNPWLRNNERKEIYTLLIGFSWKRYKTLERLPTNEVYDSFIAAYEQRAAAAIKLLERKLLKRNLTGFTFKALFLPVPSFAEVRQEFHRLIEFHA